MNFLTKWFSGPRFWLLLAWISLAGAIIGIFTGASEVALAEHLILTCLGFAAAEILKAVKPE